MSEIITGNGDGVDCPHCGTFMRDLWDYHWGSSDEIETECGSCGEPIRLFREISVAYRSAKREAKPMTDDAKKESLPCPFCGCIHDGRDLSGVTPCYACFVRLRAEKHLNRERPTIKAAPMINPMVDLAARLNAYADAGYDIVSDDGTVVMHGNREARVKREGSKP